MIRACANQNRRRKTLQPIRMRHFLDAKENVRHLEYGNKSNEKRTEKPVHCTSDMFVCAGKNMTESHISDLSNDASLVG